MTYYLPIDTETLDKIIRNTLIEDYQIVKENIDTLSKKNDSLSKTALEEDKNFLEGFKIVLSYYLSHVEYKNLMKDEK